MLSFSLLGNPLGRVAAGSVDVLRPTSSGAAPTAVVAPTATTPPTLSVGPFAFSQDQVASFGPSAVIVIPVAKLSDTLSDPTLVPANWAPYLQSIIFQPWAGTDDAGNKKSFGNYWYNDSFASDHLPTTCGVVPEAGKTLVSPFAPPSEYAGSYENDDNDTLSPVHDMAWSAEPIKQQSYRDWMTAFGVQPDQDYFMGMLGVFSTGTAYWDVAGWWNHFPVATFTNPADNQLYGIWIQLTPQGTSYVAVEKPTEGWSQSIYPWPWPFNGCNAPFNADLVIASISYAKSLQPSNKGWLQYFDPANWFGYLKALWNAVVAPIACDVLKGLPPGPAGQAALAKMGWVGTITDLAILLSNCGITPAVDCTNPANVLNPTCQVVQAPDCTLAANAQNPICLALQTTPWYTQWWGIGLLAMLGVGGVLVWRSKEAPTK